MDLIDRDGFEHYGNSRIAFPRGVRGLREKGRSKPGQETEQRRNVETSKRQNVKTSKRQNVETQKRRNAETRTGRSGSARRWFAVLGKA